MSPVDRARSLAAAALAIDLPDRWLHVQGVVELARSIAGAVAGIDDELLVQAAWLHDIGYSPTAAECGFHPLDGARYLAANGVGADVVALVAHHSAAAIEARLRGIRGLDIYTDAITPTRDALWYCDASTGPQGQRWKATERWAEVRRRYGPDHLVSRFIDVAEPSLSAAVDRTEHRLRGIPDQED